MSPKSQSSMEFLVLASFMFLFFVGFAAVIGTKMVDFQEILNTRQVQDIMDVIKTEIQLAATSMDGYQRSFYLPDTLDGKNYTLGLRDENTLIILYNEKRYESFVPGTIDSDTTIYKGKNMVIKSNGKILITSSDPCQWLTPGDESYCIGGTCYCNSGFYDSHCDEALYGEPDDGVREDDFVVDHCGNTTLYANPRIETLACIPIDPCNLPPVFSPQPTVLSAGEEEATITFGVSKEDFKDVSVSYLEISNPLTDCDESTQFTGSLSGTYDIVGGPYAKTVAHTFVVKDLIPEKKYCFQALIHDLKGTPAKSVASPTTTFTTTADMTAPTITDITITPDSIYLGTEFTIQAIIDKPSGLDKADIIINSTAGNEHIITSAINDPNMEYDAETGMLTLDLIVQDTFIDRNSSVIYNPQKMPFYNRFDNPASFDAEQAGGSRTATTAGSPASVKGRFSNAVGIKTDDKLFYPTLGNIDLSKGTIEFWTKTAWIGSDSSTHYFFEEGTSGSGGQRISLAKSSNNLFFSIHYSDGDSKSVSIPLSSPDFEWSKDTWYFVAATWDFTAGNIVLYINSTQKNSLGSVPALSDSSPNFAVGSALYDSSNIFGADAIIDSFVIFNEARTQAEIASDMVKERTYSIDLDLEDSSPMNNHKYYPALKPFTVIYKEASG